MCDAGLFQPRSDGVHAIKLGRHNHSISGLHYALCNACGTRGYLPGQLRENRRLHRAFEDSQADFISPTLILELREKYGLSQVLAAKLFGGGVQAFSKYENGKVTPAESTTKLMKLAFSDPEIMRKLAELSGVELGCNATPRRDLRNFEVKFLDFDYQARHKRASTVAEFESGARSSKKSENEFVMDSHRSIVSEEEATFWSEFQEMSWDVQAVLLTQSNPPVLN